ncbi:MAG: transcriptional regulator [Alphaproteobacteria bacterium]
MTGAAVQIAQESWGAGLPAWVLALAQAIDAEGGAMPRAQKLTAERIGYSNAVVHEVLRNRYRGDHAKVAARVAQCLATDSADCPVLGRISHAECHAHQARKSPGSTPLKVRLYRACRVGCPHSFIETKKDGRDA